MANTEVERHTGVDVEDIFLIGFALAIWAIVFRDWWMRRRGWTR